MQVSVITVPEGAPFAIFSCPLALTDAMLSSTSTLHCTFLFPAFFGPITAVWFLSLGGGATLLAYALYRRDPVFIVGQGAGLFIYMRNLVLIYRESAQGAHGGPQSPAA